LTSRELKSYCPVVLAFLLDTTVPTKTAADLEVASQGGPGFMQLQANTLAAPLIEAIIRTHQVKSFFVITHTHAKTV